MIVVTVAAALWSVLYRANPELALLLIGPISCVAIAAFFRKLHLLFWLPALSLIYLAMWSEMRGSINAAIPPLVVMLAAIIIAFFYSVFPRIRKRFEGKESLEGIVYYSVLVSMIAGALIALSIGVTLMLIGIVLWLRLENQNAELIDLGVYATMFFPLFGGAAGLFIGIPLGFFANAILRRNTQKQATSNRTEANH